MGQRLERGEGMFLVLTQTMFRAHATSKKAIYGDETQPPRKLARRRNNILTMTKHFMITVTNIFKR